MKDDGSGLTHPGVMFALFQAIALVNVVVTAVSALGHVSAAAARSHLFDKLLSSDCGTYGPASCSSGPTPSNLCCYEAPGVRPNTLLPGRN